MQRPRRIAFRARATRYGRKRCGAGGEMQEFAAGKSHRPTSRAYSDRMDRNTLRFFALAHVPLGKPASTFPEHALNRLLPQNGHPPQQAALAGGEIGARMQGAAVVPHQDVARPPDMLVDELSLLLVLEELLQERVALLPRQAVDLARHQAVHVERLAPGRR